MASASPASSVPQFPVIIAEWPRNDRGEVVRVALEEYNGNRTVNIRTWYKAADGELRPGRSGITLGIRHLRSLADALAKGVIEAGDRGLINEGDVDGGAR